MLNNNLFPYEKYRPFQKEMIGDVYETIRNEKHLLLHAPTGIGKTASVLSPSLSCAIEKNLTIFFLTTRHTQHDIVMKTLSEIKRKAGKQFICASIIGKKWMCALDDTKTLPSRDFFEFCRSVREDKACSFYENYKKGGTDLKLILEESSCRIIGNEELISLAKKNFLCPYETGVLLAKKASVIVLDYFYLLNPFIRDSFLKKLDKDLSKSIIIVDESHNLPERVRNMLRFRLTNNMVKSAIKEAKKFGMENCIEKLSFISDIMKGFSKNVKIQKLVKKDDLINSIESVYQDIDEVIDEFSVAADAIRVVEKRSSIGGVANFLENWCAPQENSIRLLHTGKMDLVLELVCIDPSQIITELIQKSYSTIFMSGTLTPINIYAEIFGAKNASLKEYPSPFPVKNRKVLIIPKTSTKYSLRNAAQYEQIAKICNEIIDAVPGNTAFFFPSYDIRNNVLYWLKTNRTLFLEKPLMLSSEKKKMLNALRMQSNGVLLGVASGSFGEGIDLKGVLSAVVVIGIPLEKPDLEKKEIIKHYDKKFGNGLEYGYIIPAMTRCLQNAGRCIRSEKDRGVLIFLDERYTWQRYRKYFPIEWNSKITMDYVKEIKNFFM